MSSNGAGDLLVQARSALLDALTALSDHRDSVVVIGAQAIYLHTGAAEVALAEATKDSDLALDSRSLGPDPLIEAAMTRANFILYPTSRQPGSWINVHGIPVDLMVPEAIAGGSPPWWPHPATRSDSDPASRRTRGSGRGSRGDGHPLLVEGRPAGCERAGGRAGRPSRGQAAQAGRATKRSCPTCRQGCP